MLTSNKNIFALTVGSSSV